MGQKRYAKKHLGWAVCGAGILALSVPVVHAEAQSSWE